MFDAGLHDVGSGAAACLDPGPWWTVAVVVVCTIGQYLLFPLNYALALVSITPMALLDVLDRAVSDDPRLADLAPAEHLLTGQGYAALGHAWRSHPAAQPAA
ncbi:hypothetical protein ABT025_37095 [Streptomyces sp. NPDC002809]|uniref:hypothetical protein n=1 Tax=Streptomyces sp. NPDC002809 TaxID=3154433 RepID=UPI00332B343A